MIIGKTEILISIQKFRAIYILPAIEIQRCSDNGKWYVVYIYLLWLRRGIVIEFNNGYFPF
jgi:hypothetical protein